MISVFSLQVNLPRHILTELGVQLGLCDRGSQKSHQLAQDYFSFIKMVKEEQMRGEGEGRCWAEVNRLFFFVESVFKMSRPSSPPWICFHLFYCQYDFFNGGKRSWPHVDKGLVLTEYQMLLKCSLCCWFRCCIVLDRTALCGNSSWPCWPCPAPSAGRRCLLRWVLKRFTLFVPTTVVVGGNVLSGQSHSCGHS